MSDEDVTKKSKDELKHEAVKKVREQEKEIFSSLRNTNYEALMSDAYTEMDAFSNMCFSGISTGCLIEGSAGVGKSFRVINGALKVLNANDIAYLDSFITPTSLYIWMFMNRNKKVLIVDDCASFLSNEKILALLKGALWNVNGKRLVHYVSTKPLQDEDGVVVPNLFEMNASIIIITNFLNRKSPHVNAVLSRINYCNVELSLDELFSIMDVIIKTDYTGLVYDERKLALDFLKEECGADVQNLNIRNLFKLYQYILFDKTKNGFISGFWKILGRKMLEKDERITIVEALLDDSTFVDEEERIRKFIELMNSKGYGKGASRSTYFRLKKEITGKAKNVGVV